MSEYLTPELIKSLLVAISLAACAGFRIFLPLLVTSMAIQAHWLTVHSTFEWLASAPVFMVLGVATVTEISGYKIPKLDKVFDVIAAPISVLAGTVLAASVLVGLPMQAQLIVGLIAGGFAAGIVYRMTSILRTGSSRFTGGIANQFLSKFETFMALVSSLVSIFLPTLAFISFIIFCLISYKFMKMIKNAKLMTMNMNSNFQGSFQGGFARNTQPYPEENEIKDVYPSKD